MCRRSQILCKVSRGIVPVAAGQCWCTWWWQCARAGAEWSSGAWSQVPPPAETNRQWCPGCRHPTLLLARRLLWGNYVYWHSPSWSWSHSTDICPYKDAIFCPIREDSDSNVSPPLYNGLFSKCRFVYGEIIVWAVRLILFIRHILRCWEKSVCF